MRIQTIFLIILSTLLLQCKNEVVEPFDDAVFGYDYYPLEVNKYRIYQIDSIQFDLGDGDLPVFDSTRFFLREDTREVFDDLEGNELFRIERSRSESLDGPWVPYDVITRSRTGNQAYSTENNIRLVSLSFPVRKESTWNGTAYVNDRISILIKGESIEMYRGWDFKVLEEGVSENIGNFVFDEVATIQQADSENPFEKRYSLEKYAKGIGMVFRERQIVDSYCKYRGDNAECVGLEWIDKSGRGFFTREILVDHN